MDINDVADLLLRNWLRFVMEIPSLLIESIKSLRVALPETTNATLKVNNESDTPKKATQILSVALSAFSEREIVIIFVSASIQYCV